MQYLTVEEVADRLNLSVATVRRRCADGDIEALKAGTQWLIDPDALERVPARRRRRASAQLPAYDLKSALGHVVATDLSELWVPDVLRFKDQIENSDELIEAVARKLSDFAFGHSLSIDIPKTLFSNRPGSMLGLADKVAYQAVVATFADEVEKRLADQVYSARRAKNSKYFFERGTKRWVRFKKSVLKYAEENPEYTWVAKADVSAYFDHIIHSVLFDELSHLGVKGEPLRALREMLTRWANVPGMGLPQGPNASRSLGNFYLLPVDEVMKDAGTPYYRYMDDIRILARSKPAAIAALRKFEQECRQRGLILSSHKTDVLPIDVYKDEDTDPAIDQAAYFFDNEASLDRTRPALKKVLKASLRADSVAIGVRGAKFSIWRLGRIREHSVLGQVLASLERLAPVASVVAAFLKHFVRRASVQRRISEFLADESRSYSPYLRSWVFATMLELSDPPEEWRRLAEWEAQDRNRPTYLRAIAVCVLARARLPRDIKWIRDQVSAEYDPEMVRACLVALAYAGSLDKRTISDAASRFPELAKVGGWLRGRRSLPSLVDSNAWIDVGQA